MKQKQLLSSGGLLLLATMAASQASQKPEGPTLEEEILVRSSRQSDFRTITAQAQQLVDLPGADGDPLQAVFSLPGVVFDSSEAGAPAVRGSSPADNLFLIDGMPAGYIFHNTFSTSILYEHILHDFELYSAGFGPQYGNATGAVFDIRLRAPKTQPPSATFDLSFLRTGVFLESGLTENSAFYLSHRFSNIHHFLDDDSLEEDEGLILNKAPRDRDYQFKYHWQMTENSHISVSANGARDRAGVTFTDQSDAVMQFPDLEGEFDAENRFDSYSVQWGASLGQGQVELIAGQYDDRIRGVWGDGYRTSAETESRHYVADFSHPVGQRHTLSIGGRTQDDQSTYDIRALIFACTELDPDCELRRGDVADIAGELRQQQTLAYLNDYWQVTDTVALDLGVQWHHSHDTDEQFVHPRLALAWEFLPRWTLTSSAGTYSQIPEAVYLLPELGSPELKSSTAEHYTLGLEHDLTNQWRWSLELYYKSLKDLPLARDDAQQGEPLYTNSMSGTAYGADLLINKSFTNNWHGWLSLSYGRSTRRNDLTGETLSYPLDTPIVFNLVTQYQFPVWEAGLRFTSRSGQATTPVIGFQDSPFFEDTIAPVYGEPFSERLPTYHRLDLRFKREFSLFNNPGQFSIDIMNVLNRENVMARGLDHHRTLRNDELHLKDQASLGTFPSLGLSITF